MTVTDKVLSDQTINLFENLPCYTEISPTDQCNIKLHIEDADGVAEPVLSLEQAKQLMAALGRQIWAIENELDI